MIGNTAPVLNGKTLHQAIAACARRYFPMGKCEVFIFGSEAAGQAHRGSDVDIGIKGGAPIPFRVITLFRDDLEKLRTLRMFDVVDFSLASENFRREALKTIIPLNAGQ